MKLAEQKWTYGLLALSFALVTVSLLMIFVVVPTEATMGVIQRIFYYHVPVAWVAADPGAPWHDSTPSDWW